MIVVDIVKVKPHHRYLVEKLLSSFPSASQLHEQLVPCAFLCNAVAPIACIYGASETISIVYLSYFTRLRKDNLRLLLWYFPFLLAVPLPRPALPVLAMARNTESDAEPLVSAGSTIF